MFVTKEWVLRFWHNAIGQADTFELEARIFHGVCLLIMAGTAVNVPFNCWIGLGGLGLLMTGILVAVGAVYYLSRFGKQLRPAILIFQLLSNVLLALNYLYNSGINGPTIAIFLLTLVITLATVPKKQYTWWLGLNVATFLALTFLDGSGSKLVKDSYVSPAARYEDFRYTYLVVAALITFILIFVRKAYEKERRGVAHQAAELEASNQTKNKLLSILAHDLKDPLASLQNYLELLTEYRIDEAEKAEIERQLLVRTRQASELLMNVLSWTRSQMGGLQAELVPVYARQALHTAVSELVAAANDKGIELAGEADQNLCSMADINMLQVIIRNLVMNAIKFTPPDGKVSLTAAGTDDRVQFMVKDTGIGMSEMQQATLFTLSGASHAGTNQEKGTGLGLLLCRNLAELQRGSLTCASKPGEGSTFILELPRCTQGTAPAEKPELPAREKMRQEASVSIR